MGLQGGGAVLSFCCFVDCIREQCADYSGLLIPRARETAAGSNLMTFPILKAVGIVFAAAQLRTVRAVTFRGFAISSAETKFTG
jgi:hypothetical protein